MLFTSLTVSCSQPVVSENFEIPDDIDIEDADKFFPKVNVNDYYHLIEFEDHQPIITDKLKLQFVKDVISRVASSKGKIVFTEEKITNSHVVFKFWRLYKDKNLVKTYTLQICK